MNKVKIIWKQTKKRTAITQHSATSQSQCTRSRRTVHAGARVDCHAKGVYWAHLDSIVVEDIYKVSTWTDCNNTEPYYPNEML